MIKVQISPRIVVFIPNALMCCLGHRLCILAAVPGSTQPVIPSGSLNGVPASAGVKVSVAEWLARLTVV